MGTRSMIGIALPSGEVKAIYCHWDGYPEHNGQILLDHYTDRAKVEALIALGSLSILGKELGEKHDFNDYDARGNGCTAHHRDRGDELRVETYQSKEWLEENNGCEFYYTFNTDGTWWVRDVWAGTEPELLSERLAKKEAA